MKNVNWQYLILGLRKKLNLSQQNLSSIINVNRKNFGRYELAERIPNTFIQDKIIRFVKKMGLNLEELQSIGIVELKVSYRIKESKIELSEDLAELVGIMIGDGEFKKDAEMRISFNPYNEMDYVYSRIIPLVKSITNKTPSFESFKRIRFSSRGFQLFLKNRCGINPGEKYENNIKIPKWCFSSERYLCATLRGIFDSDGYFGYEPKHYVEIMLGRFSSRAIVLVNSISDAMNNLGIKHSVRISGDGRYKIRITNDYHVTKFFELIGSSNYKHIIRFLMWKLTFKSIKIEKDGYENCIYKFENTIGFKKTDIRIPFIYRDMYA